MYITVCNHSPDYQQFKFIVEEDAALPVDATFWDYLLRSSQIQWSLIVYEQDWLDVQYPRTRALLVSYSNFTTPCNV